MVTYNDIVINEAPLSVIGLGYVGLPIAIAFARKVSVIGFDIDEAKVENYKNGIDPTGEVGDEELKQSTVIFTTNPDDLGKSKFHIVTVPTPVSEDNSPDFNPLISACETLGAHLASGSVVVFESTVYPGVTEEICVPVLEQKSGLICGKDFKVGYSPERINPGDKIHRLETITKVVSAMDAESLELVSQVYELVVEVGTYRASSIKVAEAAKVIENSQRDINIAFVNELSHIFRLMGIDTLEVLKAAGTKWNFLNFTPGLVGGHCIGVDPYYLAYCAQKKGYHPQIILSGRQVNDRMGRVVAENAVKRLVLMGRDVSKSVFAILGLTFKENCPDIRNTRVIDIINELDSYGVMSQVADPIADAKESAEHYGITLQPIANLRQADCLIVAVAHDEFKNLVLGELIVKGGLLVDVKGMFNPETVTKMGYEYWRL